MISWLFDAVVLGLVVLAHVRLDGLVRKVKELDLASSPGDRCAGAGGRCRYPAERHHQQCHLS